MQSKADLRKALRAKRRAHVEALPAAVTRLILNRPPTRIAEMLRGYSTIGLYHAAGAEAPTLGWARWLHENGWQVALPWFADRGAAMEFRLWSDPWNEDQLVPAPYGGLQPAGGEPAEPEALIVPLVAFTADGHRLGQGGGHYDRWLEAHPQVLAIGLAWDVQRVEALPLEAHDRTLDAVVTPTQIYGGEP